jgi:hypothetical protein
VFLLEDAGIVQECAEVAARDIFHSKIDKLRILEGVEKPNKPGGLGRGEDVTLHQNVANLNAKRVKDA